MRNGGSGHIQKFRGALRNAFLHHFEMIAQKMNWNSAFPCFRDETHHILIRQIIFRDDDLVDVMGRNEFLQQWHRAHHDRATYLRREHSILIDHSNHFERSALATRGLREQFASIEARADQENTAHLDTGDCRKQKVPKYDDAKEGEEDERREREQKKIRPAMKDPILPDKKEDGNQYERID